MTSELCDIVRRHLRPLEPAATPIAPALQTLHGVRAVLFDIYGTLLISASGDVGTSIAEVQATALTGALRAVGIDKGIDAAQGVQCITQVIRDAHEAARAEGIEYPEVDIREIWRTALAEFGVRDLSDFTLRCLALEYEMEVNPVWPMPHARKCLDDLAGNGCILGLVSNAQYYTPAVVTTLLEGSLSELGFDAELRYFSYRHRQAKPGSYLYDLAARELAGRGISGRQVMYVGNDMLKDIWPASGHGFRTALFAGDARSLRLREDDERVRGLQPDLVVKDLAELADCVQPD